MEQILTMDEPHETNQPKMKKAKMEDSDTSIMISIPPSLSVDHKSPPENNPFLAPPVLRSLMKFVVHPTELKELRKVCDVWDQVIIDELKKRAFRGEVKSVNLSGWDKEKDFNAGLSNSELSAKFTEFFEDTRDHRTFIRDFQFNFPQFLRVLDQKQFQSFLRDYSPCFLSLESCPIRHIYDTKDVERLNYFLDKLAPNLKELELFRGVTFRVKYSQDKNYDGSKGGRFPVLQKLTLDGSGASDLFKMILGGKEWSAPNLRALDLMNISIGDVDGTFAQTPANWTQLTHLNIGGRNDDASLIKRTSHILSLGRSGMSLKSFSMNFTGFPLWENDMAENYLHEEFDLEMINLEFTRICSNLTAFFQTQAHSLQDLSLTFDIQMQSHSDSDPDSFKIHLPVFTDLRRLKLFKTTYKVNNQLVESPLSFDSFTHNFPSLEELTVRKWGDIKHCGGKYEANEGPLLLKRLKLSEAWDKGYGGQPPSIEGEMMHLLRDVCSLETFEVNCTDGGNRDEYDFFTQNGEELSWISLKVLHLYKISRSLKLGHLENLKTLIIEENGLELRKGDEFMDAEEFLLYFKHIAKLDLDLIKFWGIKNMDQETRAQIVKYFPFKVEFWERPTPNWRC